MPTLSDIPTDELMRMYQGGGNAPTDLSKIPTEELMRQYGAPAPKQEDVPGQISLPLIGKPSLVNMVKSILGSAKSAVTLPGDVYAGKVDPLSEEGIGRAVDMAGLATALPGTSFPSVVTRGATAAPLASKQLEEMASGGYNAIRDRARSIPLQEAPALAEDIASYTAKKGPTALRARDVYDEIGKIGSAEDVGQLTEIRRNLRDIVRGGGESGKAADLAINRLDFEIEKRAPGMVQPIRELDKNYAISKNAQELEQKIRDARTKAEVSGTEGTHIRNVLRGEITGGNDQFVSPGVREAIGGVVSPGGGVRALRGMSLLDPTRHPWITAATAAATLGKSAAAAIPGYVARKGYDSIIRRRANDAVRAILEEAPANSALTPGYMPRARIGMQSQYPQPSIPLLSNIMSDQ